MIKEKQCAVLIKQIHTELEKNANNALRQDDLTMSQINVLLELDKAADKQLELKRLEQMPFFINAKKYIPEQKYRAIFRFLVVISADA